ncbi:zinc finger protein 2-like [Cherax quadricarinatus]
MDCPHCGKLLSTWWAYERHLSKFHAHEIPEEVKQEKAALEAALNSPQVSGKKKRGRKKKIQQCETCSEIFNSRPALTYHIATKHSSTMHMCDRCPAVFPHRALLASHILRHGERRVMCHRCGRKFFTQKQLNSHENLFHRRARSYSCETCGGRFSTLRVLRHHIRTQPHHKFYCQECGVSYGQKQQYLTHMLTHGLRCTLCNRSFSSAVAAHQHYRTTHSQTESNANANTVASIKCNTPKNLTPCIRTHSLYEPRDKGSKKQVTTFTRAEKIVSHEAENIKFEAEEDDSVVIVVSSEGDADVTHYTQAETHEALQHIIKDEDDVCAIKEEVLPYITQC